MHHNFGSGLVPAHRHVNPDGSIGGWVADSAFVAPTAYVGSHTKIFENAQILDNARVTDYAQVYGNATVAGNAEVHDYAAIFEHADISDSAKVYDNVIVCGHAFVCGQSAIYGYSRIGGDYIANNITITNVSRGIGNFAEPEDLEEDNDFGDPEQIMAFMPNEVNVLSGERILRADNNMSRKFGVEIEIVGTSHARVVDQFNRAGIPIVVQNYNHNNLPSWKIVPDGSLTPGGFEVVSPILEGEAGITQVRKVARALVAAGASADRTCGFHVHVNARDLSVDTIVNIAARYNRFENDINQFMPQSRHASRFCHGMNDLIERGGVSRLLRGGTRSFANIDRYRKVNLAAYARHGTVEFRQHAGTVNAIKMDRWIRFCLEFVEASVVPPMESQAPSPRRRAPASMSPAMAEKVLRLYNRFLAAGEFTPIRISTLMDEFEWSETSLRRACGKIKTLYGRQIEFSPRPLYERRPQILNARECWLNARLYPVLTAEQMAEAAASVQTTTRRELPVIENDWVFRGLSPQVSEFFYGRALQFSQNNAERETRRAARRAERDALRAQRAAERNARRAANAVVQAIPAQPQSVAAAYYAGGSYPAATINLEQTFTPSEWRRMFGSRNNRR